MGNAGKDSHPTPDPSSAPLRTASRSPKGEGRNQNFRIWTEERRPYPKIRISPLPFGEGSGVGCEQLLIDSGVIQHDLGLIFRKDRRCR